MTEKKKVRSVGSANLTIDGVYFSKSSNLENFCAGVLKMVAAYKEFSLPKKRAAKGGSQSQSSATRR